MPEPRAAEVRRGARRRRPTEEVTALIDWALGDVPVDPAVEHILCRAARASRAAECKEMRRRAA
ncbi:MAG TPA: hypothetical protein VMU14_07135 [Acidimicrobiales bacterium]|nr:hypothetical protein [Acidimicrobiales bacterium]